MKGSAVGKFMNEMMAAFEKYNKECLNEKVKVGVKKARLEGKEVFKERNKA